MIRVAGACRARPVSAHRLVLFALSALFACGAGALSAHADNRPRGDFRGGGHPVFHGRPGYAGGYYPPPPVVYGAPYYPPPPVVYAPGVGINLPGVNITIR